LLTTARRRVLAFEQRNDVDDVEATALERLLNIIKCFWSDALKKTATKHFAIK
tara:strand:- start:543 stop:701 length:159 start_codon:yes stop_codon:yes gene_type:complete